IEASGPTLENIRRLTLDEAPALPHSWTGDSKSVIFERRASGPVQGKTQWDVFLQSIGDRVSRPLATTAATEFYPVLSPNPGWVLFQQYEADKGRAAQRLMRVPLAGGPAEPVPAVGSFDEFRCAVAGSRCILRATENKQQVYYEVDAFKGRGRELLRTAWISEVMGDWDLSADGTLIAVPNHNPTTATIHLFGLDPKPGQPAEWDTTVPGLASLYNIRWDTRDQGWYASVRVPSGVVLTYIHRDGRFVNLRAEPLATWGVPAPDGKRLAFLGQDVETNFWRVHGL
ncbi:MAG TPA: hypothetical protein VEQ63_11305, partial [Bryobacteraceae bacterium]|nr:hypothetical protein [Bryobacteraceae bacterium]